MLRIIWLTTILIYASSKEIHHILRDSTGDGLLDACSVNETTHESLCDCSWAYDGTVHVDCSERELKTIPLIPNNTTVLDLHGNWIDRVDYNQFITLNVLKSLDLSQNSLAFISATAFNGLSALENIKLGIGDAPNKDFLAPGSLKDLSLLRNFSLTFYSFQTPEINCSDSHPEERALFELICVKHIEIDPSYLPLEGGVLRSLERLTITGDTHCFLSVIDRYYFNGMPNLKYLTISHIKNIKILSKDCFHDIHLVELHVFGSSLLVVPDPDLNILRAVSLAVASMDTLITLDITNVYADVTRQHYLSCTNDLPGLNQLRIQNLILDNNILIPVFESCQTLPSTIIYFSIQRNCLPFNYVVENIMTFLPNAVSIDASHQNNCPHIGYKRDLRKQDATVVSDISSNLTYHLEHFRYTGYSGIIPAALGVHHGGIFDMMTYFDFYGNTIDTDAIPSNFHDIFPRVQYLDMSNCNIRRIETNAFIGCSKLVFLNLSNNSLSFTDIETRNSFYELSSLDVFLLSGNNIEHLPSDAFSKLVYVHKLDVSRNKLHAVSLSLIEFKELTYLDVSSNNIKALTELTMGELDELARESQVFLDLTGNPLLCTCKTQSFVNWFASSRVNFNNYDHLQCSLENGTDVRLKGMSTLLDRECRSYTVVIILIFVFGTFALAILSCGLVYRNRWGLRHCCHVTKHYMPIFGNSESDDDENQYVYDAFISYSSDDSAIARTESMAELEVKAGLTLCIHERDFKPGERIALNTSNAIHNSKRTILMISRYFISSEWCMHELDLARRESLAAKRTLILVVLLDSIPTDDTPAEILDITRTYTYLEYPAGRSARDISVFWERCADFINS